MRSIPAARHPLCVAIALLLFYGPGTDIAAASTDSPIAPRSIIELQAHRQSESVTWSDTAKKPVAATLTHLNPEVNAQFLLTLRWPEGQEVRNYHLENPLPTTQHLALSTTRPGQLSIETATNSFACVLWPPDALHQARQSRLAFAPLCDGHLFLRNAVPGNRSALEATTQFLRDYVWHGEQIIDFVRRRLYQDAFIEPATPPAPGTSKPAVGPAIKAPPPARGVNAAAPAVTASSLAIDIRVSGPVMQGHWYAAVGLDGVYISVAQPASLPEGTTIATGLGRKLDAVESGALVYLVAFDLAAFELGFALGTEHPRLGWSARTPANLRDPGLPGPDGIANAVPLVRTGMLNPALLPQVVASFTGGFKREHGAFRYGTLSAVNHASHYGFVEQGVVYSRLMPGLATLYVLGNGSIGMKTWTREDDQRLGPIRHARQNGVPLLERDQVRGTSSWGPLVDAWGPGNWSGSADEKLRTLRAGGCLIEQAGQRFLVYGYFSTATPRAMARVFHSYGCSYAMHLDMNALEHTYLAVYRRKGGKIEVGHLIAGMAALDPGHGVNRLPRFLGFADERDFFYLLSRPGLP